MKQIKRPIGRPVIIIDRVTITRSVPRTAVVIIDQLIKELANCTNDASNSR